MTPDAYPISHPVAVADLIREERQDIVIDATTGQRAALAGYLGIPAVGMVQARLTARAQPGRRFVLEGRVRASLTQTCVVTLEPVAEEIDAVLHRVYEDAPAEEDDNLIDPFDEDLPEPVDGGVIDAGAAVCELIALEMSPYPRREGAEPLENKAATPPEESAASHPFAALSRLRKTPD